MVRKSTRQGGFSVNCIRRALACIGVMMRYSHAANAPELRMLQHRSASGIHGGLDLFVRVHVLHFMRRVQAGRSMPQLRRYVLQTACPSRGPSCQVSGFGGANLQTWRLFVSGITITVVCICVGLACHEIHDTATQNDLPLLHGELSIF